MRYLLYFVWICLPLLASAQLTVVARGNKIPTLLYKGKPMLKVGPLPEVVPFAVGWGS